jgi:hypothetical protein
MNRRLRLFSLDSAIVVGALLLAVALWSFSRVSAPDTRTHEAAVRGTPAPAGEALTE